MAATTFVLPDLHAITPFVSFFNPHYDKISPEATAWVVQFSVLSGRQRAHYISSMTQLLTPYTYPRANEERYRCCCDYVSILFIYDEITDHQSGEDARSSSERACNAMEDANFDDGTALCRLIHDFSRRLSDGCGPVTFQRFISYWKLYVNAVTKEAQLREHDEVLDPDSYQQLRREFSSVRASLVISGYALGIDLSDEVFNHPTFSTMYLAATDMVCVANDLYSYNMEQAMGAGHGGNNLLTVLMKHKGLDLQGAVDYVGEYWKTLVERYLNAKRDLPSWSEEIDKDVAQYAVAMEDWVIGSMDWSFESPRYFGAVREEVKGTRVVHLYPSRLEAA
ncbi:terpenoid synthase [Cubamyces sp. BRFM 1775]|nr:terpenoid synthase [Cubamyces sp. BRFM 1775]